MRPDKLIPFHSYKALPRDSNAPVQFDQPVIDFASQIKKCSHKLITRRHKDGSMPNKMVIDSLVEMTIDRGRLVKKLINCLLIKRTWKIVEANIYKTYINLTNLTDALDQSALASRSSVTMTSVLAAHGN